MRELKFRAFDTENKTWTFVTLGDLICGACTENGDKPLSGAKQVWEQYTGLKDKNGKEIYEGDVVHYTEKIAPNKSSTYEVYYDQLHAMYALSPVDGKIDVGEFYGYIMRQQYEVIGNIHENPELLEGKK